MSVFAAVEYCRQRGEASVLVTVADVRGSAPRGVGTRMLVMDTRTVGTIGGGALEQDAVLYARELLLQDPSRACLCTREWVLGKALSQCCGGRVRLQFDRIPACGFRIEVFGAGHVAQQVALLASHLPCIATFHDARTSWLQRLPSFASPFMNLSEGSEPASVHEGVVRARCLDDNVYAVVEACRPGSYFLVMTHSHELDLEVVEAVLSRQDAAFCGLIASRSKAQAFRSRLSRKGFSDAEIAGLSSPLGSKVQTGSTPMEVAIAAMADVLDARGKPERVECSENTATVPSVISRTTE